ncbi:MAG: NPCBM/NEW2 domain-containing protein [Lentisphaeraceae bacterium]|nr:NPCBM/NEW2 domain-containing protein [Lentisphaeraceae bacterium]
MKRVCLLLSFLTLGLFAEQPLATNKGEYLILKNGSVIQGKTSKLDSKKGELIFTRQKTEYIVSLDLVEAISFQGSFYPPTDAKVGFILASGQLYKGAPAYFTSTMIGRSKPSKMRFKKKALTFLILSPASVNKTSIKVYGLSREILCGEKLTESNDQVTVQTPIGALSFNKEQVVKIEQLAKSTLLNKSHLQSSKTQPFLSSVKRPLFNKTFNTDSLQAQGFPLQHFISLHSRTELSLELPAQSNRFTASAFIDPSATNGDLNLIIQQNGKKLYKARIYSGQSPQEINIPVKSGPLTIIADYGKRGSAGDFLILANPQISEVN